MLLSLQIPALMGQQKVLPKGFAPEELGEMLEYLDSRASLTEGIITPPPSPVRTMAEWEEIQALVVTWVQYLPTLREIVRYSREECEVIIVCNDSNQVKNYLIQGNVPLSNISYVETLFNSIWMRDYGANTVYAHGVDSLYMIDWIYNRPRPLDDQIPDELASFIDRPIYSTTTPPFDLVHTGGNFMTDGMGTGFSSNLILDENSSSGQFNPTNKSESEIDLIMSQFMGIDRYIKMPVLPYDGIHHIDMHMKLLDEETLLVGEYPIGVADGPQIEANLTFILNNHLSGFDYPYEVVRIPMPPHNGLYPNSLWADYRTYTNAVFVNKTLLVPTYEQKYDTTALRILRESLPGYRVVGINCNQIIKAGGALHCITRAIGVDDPLLIQHRRLRDIYENNYDYQVNANISHQSGVKNATIYFRTDTTDAFQAIEMLKSPTGNNLWTGFIPIQNSGEEVFYYIAAEANSGKTITRPLTAPEGYWKFDIIGPNTKIENYLQTGMILEKAYPNPTQSITWVPLNFTQPTFGSLKLYDPVGRISRVVYEGAIPKGESKYFFDASTLSPGSYILSLDTESGRMIQQVRVR